MIATALAPLAVPLERLSLLPGNPRQGDVSAVARSLSAFGQRKPIVANRDGTIIAGNHTWQAAQALGWAEIAVVFVDDDEATAKAFALADNRTAELGGYDDAALAVLIADVAACDADLLAATGWSEEDLAVLLLATQPPTVHGDPDELPEPPAALTVPGDVWRLGPHRVMCGDSTSPTDLERLMVGREADAMVTDPPYGIDYGGAVEYRRRVGRGQRPADNSSVVGDDLGDAAELWAAAFPLWLATLRLKGSAFYCWSSAMAVQIALGAALQAAGGEVHGSVVWVKSQLSFSRSDHKYKHEPCWYGWRADGTHAWHGPSNEVSVWEYPKPKASPEHPTQKPVDLFRRCLRNITAPGGLAIDPFLGSGTTILAAHLEGRVAYGMEISPRYVDVVCKRWQVATGLAPIAEATGRAHDFAGPA